MCYSGGNLVIRTPASNRAVGLKNMNKKKENWDLILIPCHDWFPNLNKIFESNWTIIFGHFFTGWSTTSPLQLQTTLSCAGKLWSLYNSQNCWVEKFRFLLVIFNNGAPCSPWLFYLGMQMCVGPTHITTWQALEHQTPQHEVQKAIPWWSYHSKVRFTLCKVPTC